MDKARKEALRLIERLYIGGHLSRLEYDITSALIALAENEEEISDAINPS